MKNQNFVDPATFFGISKQEIFTMLKERINPESLAWLDYITEEMVLSIDEVWDFEYFIIDSCSLSTDVDDDNTNLDICKPRLLFARRFFNDNEWRSKEIFRTYLFNEERIKSLSLLFTKIGNKETFYPWVGEILELIKLVCTQSEEFAQAYQAKLAEIRSGSLRERLALYVNYYKDSTEISSALRIINENDCNEISSTLRIIIELEQPVLERLKEYVNLRQLKKNTIIIQFHKRPIYISDGNTGNTRKMFFLILTH